MKSYLTVKAGDGLRRLEALQPVIFKNSNTNDESVDDWSKGFREHVIAAIGAMADDNLKLVSEEIECLFDSYGEHIGDAVDYTCMINHQQYMSKRKVAGAMARAEYKKRGIDNPYQLLDHDHHCHKALMTTLNKILENIIF